MGVTQYSRDRIVAQICERLGFSMQSVNHAVAEAVIKDFLANYWEQPDLIEMDTQPIVLPKKRGPRAGSKHTIPTDFCISPELRNWAKSKGFEPYLDAHLEYFKTYAEAGGAKYINWDAAFRNCISADWGGIRKAQSPSKPRGGLMDFLGIR